MLRQHAILMALYAAGSGVFFALLWRRETRDRIRLFTIIFLALFLGGLVLGWLMFPFPTR